MNRIDWDTYFCEIAKLTAKRSGCLRRGVGAVIVKDNCPQYLNLVSIIVLIKKHLSLSNHYKLL